MLTYNPIPTTFAMTKMIVSHFLREIFISAIAKYY